MLKVRGDITVIALVLEGSTKLFIIVKSRILSVHEEFCVKDESLLASKGLGLHLDFKKLYKKIDIIQCISFKFVFFFGEVLGCLHSFLANSMATPSFPLGWA